MGAHPRGARRVLARLAPQGRPRHRRRAVRARDRRRAGDRRARTLLLVDEGVRRDTSPERLASLKPAFKADGVVTAGNSSQITDGAAAPARHERGGGEPARAAAPGAVRRRSPSSGSDPDPHAHRPDSGDREGARAGQAAPRRHGSDRDQRGVRERGARLGARGAPGSRPGQRERRRDRARPSARVLGRPSDDHAAERTRTVRSTVRAPDHVRGRRSGSSSSAATSWA